MEGNTMKKEGFMQPGNLKKIGVLLFLGGFLFAQPILAAIGAVGWGGVTGYELFTKKK
jgi:hypothetical protein